MKSESHRSDYFSLFDSIKLLNKKCKDLAFFIRYVDSRLLHHSQFHQQLLLKTILRAIKDI